MKNLALAVLAAVVVALGLLVGFQRRQIAKLTLDVPEHHVSEEAASRTPSPARPPKSVANTENFEPAIPATAPTFPRLPEPEASVAPNPKRPAAGSPDFIANLGSMMTNPAMQEMMRAQSQTMLARNYERLLKYLDMPEATADELKRIVLDRQMAMTDSGMALLDANLTTEEKTRRVKAIQTTKESYDRQIEQLLGADDYEAFQQYEATQPERMKVEMFRNSIASSDEPLTDQQEYDLVAAMYEARTNSYAHSTTRSTRTQPETVLAPSSFAEAGMKEALGRQEALQTQYVAAASTVLSPSQVARFQSFSDQQNQMTAMGMRFAAQMLGGALTNGMPDGDGTLRP